VAMIRPRQRGRGVRGLRGGRVFEMEGLRRTPLCANRTLAGDWEEAHAYAREAVTAREEMPAALIWMDFESHHETEAFLRDGDEDLAREGVRRFGERAGGNGGATASRTCAPWRCSRGGRATRRRSSACWTVSSPGETVCKGSEVWPPAPEGEFAIRCHEPRRSSDENEELRSTGPPYNMLVSIRTGD